MQVEKVICFDAHASPIRNIQRCGRTGRHEAGQVVHILGEGPEEAKYEANIQVASACLTVLSIASWTVLSGGKPHLKMSPGILHFMLFEVKPLGYVLHSQCASVPKSSHRVTIWVFNPNCDSYSKLYTQIHLLIRDLFQQMPKVSSCMVGSCPLEQFSIKRIRFYAPV